MADQDVLLVVKIPWSRKKDPCTTTAGGGGGTGSLFGSGSVSVSQEGGGVGGAGGGGGAGGDSICSPTAVLAKKMSELFPELEIDHSHEDDPRKLMSSVVQFDYEWSKISKSVKCLNPIACRNQFMKLSNKKRMRHRPKPTENSNSNSNSNNWAGNDRSMKSPPLASGSLTHSDLEEAMLALEGENN